MFAYLFSALLQFAPAGQKMVTLQSSDPYRFTYSVDSAKESTGRYRYLVRCRIRNEGPRPLYFLRYSCWDFSGMRYDEQHFSSEPRMMCNASFPVVLRLAAGGVHEWTVAFEAADRRPFLLAIDLYRLRRPIKPQIIHSRQVPTTDTLLLTGIREPIGRTPIRERPTVF